MFFVLYDKNLIDVFCIHMWNNDLFVAFSLVLVYEIENLECLIVVPFFAGKKLWREREGKREGREGEGCISPTWVMSDAMDRHGICHNSLYVFKCPTQPLDENSP